MRLEQAIYGEVTGGGHGLRASSPACAGTASELAHMMDLPDAMPPGVHLDSYLSGFAYRDWFVIARTFPDARARRAGMVISHALLVPLEEFVGLDNPELVVARLAPGADAILHPAPLDVSPPATTPAAAPDLDAVAEALVTRGGGPAVRIGTQGFARLFAALWARLWPELRRRLSFRISFGPSDAEGPRGPMLVCTPAELASRWTGPRVAWPGGGVRLSAAAQVLTGQRSSKPVLELGRQVGARLDRLDEFSLLVALHDEMERSASSPDAAVAAVRLVAAVSPDPACGIAPKEALLGTASEHIRSGSPALVLQLRNLRISAFAEAVVLWQALEARLKGEAFEPGSDAELGAVIHHATCRGGAIAHWSAAVASAFHALAGERSPTLAAAFWRLAERMPSGVEGFLELLPASLASELWLTSTSPFRLPREAAIAVQDAALRRGWLRLHGSAAAAAYPLAEAIAIQLTVDVDPRFLDGLMGAARHASPSEILRVALELREDRLLDVAAAHAAKHPAVLAEASMRLPRAISVWARALKLNPDAWRGPADPAASFHDVLDELIEGGRVDPELVDALAQTPLADVSAYPRRAELWGRLDPKAMARILSATVTGWLRRLHETSEPPPPEPPLEAAIIGDAGLDRLLRSSTGRSAIVAVRAAAVLATLPEDRMLTWIHALVTDPEPIGGLVAARAGRLVVERRWRRAAEELADAFERGRRDLDPAVRQVEALLGFLARWRLRLSPVPADEKWRTLEEVAAGLYPYGPDDERIWVRAGGRQEDLRAEGSGRAKWGDAVGRLRNGAQAPTVAGLISEMLGDFRSNPELSALQEAFRRSCPNAGSKEHR